MASIAAASGICDCCIEKSQAPETGCANGRSSEEQRFSRSLLFLLWPEKQVLRGNNLTLSYMCSACLFKEAFLAPSLQRIRQETLANFAAPPSFPSLVPAQSTGRGGGSWRKNRKLGGQAPAKRPPHKTS